MPQIFHPSANTLLRIGLGGAVVGVAALGGVFAAIQRSAYVTRVGIAAAQPVPFSHKHHVSEIGIDCLYCHTSVEESAFAGIPPTKTCMNCHVQIWASSAALEPVRESFRTGRSIEWTRVHDLPDFVYFDHSIHVARSIGCEECHGSVDRMPLTWREESLYMEWCLECHRHPGRWVGESVDGVGAQLTAESRSAIADEDGGARRPRRYGLDGLTDCSLCHR